MKAYTQIPVRIDDNDRLVLPSAVLARLGYTSGTEVQAVLNEQGLKLLPSIHRLAKVYIEPTNLCNLDCTTCMRSAWNETPGLMSRSTFDRILEGMVTFDPKPILFFGGFGEPLAHPEIKSMVIEARSAGLVIELITNGTLLDEPTSRWMVEAGLQRLWVSIDGASPENYADIRLGAELPRVIENISSLQRIRQETSSTAPKLGIAFVAMKQNIADLPEVIRIGKNLGADLFSVSGLLPHTPELRRQILYKNSLENGRLQPSEWAPIISLPRMDLENVVIDSLGKSLYEQISIQIAQEPLNLGVNRCPFVKKGSLSIRFDGAVSPCLPLLHTHTSYLGESIRLSHAHTIGNLRDHSLPELWNDSDYVKLRMRLQEFDFSPCAFCNSCQMAESNEVDCFGSDQPACGGCLWAQGFIQCP